MAEATATLTLADFLLARIAEDESYVRALFSGYAAGRQESWDSPSSGILDDGAEPVPLADGPLAYYMARWDPARVLAECEAKRRIVDVHRDKGNGFCDECDWGMPCPTLRLLALPYADHPDYREEWRP